MHILALFCGALPFGWCGAVRSLSSAAASTTSTRPNTTATTATDSKATVLLEISAGLRLNASCNISAKKDKEEFFGGRLKLENAGFDVIFPMGGKGALAEVASSMSQTRIGEPAGQLSGAMAFSPANIIPALTSIGLPADATFLLAIKDGNVFKSDNNSIPELRLKKYIDFDASSLKEKIMNGLHKVQ